MRFAEPYFFALLLALPLLLFLKLRLGRRERGAMFSDVGLVAGFHRTRRLRYRWVPAALRAVAGAISLGTLTFLAAAFARSRDLIQRLLLSASDIYEQSLYLRDLFVFFEMQPTIRSGPGAGPFKSRGVKRSERPDPEIPTSPGLRTQLFRMTIGAAV